VKSDFANLLHGTLNLLVLKALEHRPLNGAGVSKWITERSGGAFVVGPGSLYPALHRLQAASLIEIMKRTPEATRRAKTYEIKRAGRKQLVQKSQEWREFSFSIRSIVGDAGIRKII
jgi:PadR family transcriptional regulator, regulatory protein PadR